MADEDVAVLRNEIEHLRELVRDLKETIGTLNARLEHLDRRQNDTCRSCTAWTRIRDLELAIADARGMARGWALAASTIAGGVSFLAGWFVRK